MYLTIEEVAERIQRPQKAVLLLVAQGRLNVCVLARGWWGMSFPPRIKDTPRAWDVGTADRLPGGLELRAAECRNTGEKFTAETFRACQMWRLSHADAYVLVTSAGGRVEASILEPLDGRAMSHAAPRRAPWPDFQFWLDGDQEHSTTITLADALFDADEVARLTEAPGAAATGSKAPAIAAPTGPTNHQSPSGRPRCTKAEIIDGFILVGKNWDDLLSRPDGDGRRYLASLRQSGRRGKGGAALWCPITFARLLIENGDLNTGQVKARFAKAWPKWEAEMLAEIGGI